MYKQCWSEQLGNIRTITKTKIYSDIVIIRYWITIKGSYDVCCFIKMLFSLSASFWFLDNDVDLPTFKTPLDLYLRLLKCCLTVTLIGLRGAVCTQEGCTWIFHWGLTRGADSRQAIASQSIFRLVPLWLASALTGKLEIQRQWSVFYYEDFENYIPCIVEKILILILFVGVLPRIKLEEEEKKTVQTSPYPGFLVPMDVP